MSIQQRRQAHLANGLEMAGIPTDWNSILSPQFKEIGECVGKMSARLYFQSVYNLFQNLPTGAIERNQLTAKQAIEQALPGVVGTFVEWDIAQAREFAASVLEDANDHAKAAEIRGWEI